MRKRQIGDDLFRANIFYQTEAGKYVRKGIKYFQKLLNERPRKILDFKTPKDKLKNYFCVNNLNLLFESNFNK